MTIEDIDRPADGAAPVTFDGIPPEWEIKANELKLHCVDGKPIELGRGGYGVVLYGEFDFFRSLQLPERNTHQKTLMSKPD